MRCGGLRVLSGDILFPVGNGENIGAQGREDLAEILVALVGEREARAYGSENISFLDFNKHVFKPRWLHFQCDKKTGVRKAERCCSTPSLLDC